LADGFYHRFGFKDVVDFDTDLRDCWRRARIEVMGLGLMLKSRKLMEGREKC
jgi:hypothetical protein